MSTQGVRLRQECAIWPRQGRYGPGHRGAIRAGNDVFAADDRGVAKDAIGDKQRVLDKVGGVADDTRHQYLARRQLCLLPNPPLMFMPHRSWSKNHQPRTIDLEAALSRGI